MLVMERLFIVDLVNEKTLYLKLRKDDISRFDIQGDKKDQSLSKFPHKSNMYDIYYNLKKKKKNSAINFRQGISKMQLFQ